MLELHRKLHPTIDSNYTPVWLSLKKWFHYDTTATIIGCSNYAHRIDFVHSGYTFGARRFACREPSDYDSAYHDLRKVIIGTYVEFNGSCVAVEWNANAGDQAVVEKLEAMRQPDVIPNPELFSDTFNLPNHGSSCVEHQRQSGAETSTNSASSDLPKSGPTQANTFAETALPPTELDELEALQSETATKGAVFVSVAPDTIPGPVVGAHLAQKLCAEGKSVLVVGRNGADVETTWREWVKGLTNIDGASNPAGNLTHEFGLHWQGTDNRLWTYRKRISEVDVQVAGLISQAQAEPGGSETSDNLKELVANRESFIKELQAATQEKIQSAPLVFANLDSALLCAALMGRTFDVVLVYANQTTVPELMVLVGLAKTAVRIIGDCRDFSPSPYEPGSALHEFLGRDVFEFCGITRNLDRGTYDPGWRLCGISGTLILKSPKSCRKLSMADCWSGPRILGPRTSPACKQAEWWFGAPVLLPRLAKSSLTSSSASIRYRWRSVSRHVPFASQTPATRMVISGARSLRLT